MQIDIQALLMAALALIAGGIISFITTPLARLFAQKVGAVDVPKDSRRVHKHPIPRMGGLAIFLGFVLSVVLFAQIDTQMRGILLGTIIIVVIGVVDDITPLPALVKLVVQVAAALVAVAFGVRIQFLANPIWWSENMYIDLSFLSIPVTVIWIVGLTNAVNLIDGLDGLAVGVSAIASIAMMTISLAMGQWNTAIILAALVGACFGFMPYNLNPARIFMGDTGALMLGYVMACISVTGLLKFYAIVSFIVPLLALGLPIFDTAFAIIRRVAHGQNPMSPDRGHFHHRLIDMGLSQKQAVALLYAISAILGFAAVLIATSGEMRAIVLVFAFCVAFAIGLALMRSVYPERFGIKNEDEPQSPNEPSSEDKGEDESEK